MRALVLAALLFAACTPTRADEPPSAPVAVSDGIVIAAIGETADLGDGLVVRPLEVLEDSRCPTDVQCIWAGRVRLRVDVEGLGEREIVAGGGAVQTPRGAFELVLVSPIPLPQAPPRSRAPYHLGFRRAS
jgi:hypothetical protein